MNLAEFAELAVLPPKERRATVRALVLAVARRLPLVYRSVADVASEYGTLLGREVIAAFEGQLSPDTFYRDHVRWIRQLGIQAYAQGLLEGGVTQDEMDSEDESAVNSWIGTQIANARGFADAACKAGADKGKRDAVLGRLDLWINAIEALGAQGLMSAKRNAMGEWRFGGTTEHCSTCSKLNGKKHRLKWFTAQGYIPREPGSATLECGGWKCQCGIFDVLTGAQLV